MLAQRGTTRSTGDIFGICTRVGMARNEAQRWRKIWFGQSREWSTARHGCSFVRRLAAVLGWSSMKSSFQINVTYSATVRAGGEAAISLYPRKEEGKNSRAGRGFLMRSGPIIIAVSHGSCTTPR